jgi:hypothetical protein
MPVSQITAIKTAPTPAAIPDIHFPRFCARARAAARACAALGRSAQILEAIGIADACQMIFANATAKFFRCSQGGHAAKRLKRVERFAMGLVYRNCASFFRPAAHSASRHKALSCPAMLQSAVQKKGICRADKRSRLFSARQQKEGTAGNGILRTNCNIVNILPLLQLIQPVIALMIAAGLHRSVFFSRQWQTYHKGNFLHILPMGNIRRFFISATTTLPAVPRRQTMIAKGNKSNIFHFDTVWRHFSYRVSPASTPSPDPSGLRPTGFSCGNLHTSEKASISFFFTCRCARPFRQWTLSRPAKGTL